MERNKAYMNTRFVVYQQRMYVGQPLLRKLGYVDVAPFGDPIDAAKAEFPDCKHPLVEILDPSYQYYRLKRLDRMCGVTVIS